ncbi:hypothetical protein D915_008695 [Fasciola hepatica]|uniref:Uncharacterized protein n=1 Tax=Fasciola hepatica TaxID=6192 RepID=A0A4E0QYY0_FASHE|nr:hypothetical protein D915_008695 [Fasciola hepatica]
MLCSGWIPGLSRFSFDDVVCFKLAGLQIDAKVQRNCRQEEWHSDLLVPHSKLYRSYEDFMEKQIHRLLEELNYFRFVDGITVAYFYSESNHTTVVLLLDMDEQHLGQKSFTISSISRSISDRFQEQQICDGISLLVNNVECKFSRYSH